MAKSNFTLAFCTSNVENKPMRKVIAVALAAVLVTGTFATFANAAAPKAGAKCPKLNQSQIANGSKYVCFKSGKKLVWKSVGLVQPKPSTKVIDFSKTYSTDDGYFASFTDPCQMDPNIPGELADLQNYYYRVNRCAGQLQLGKYLLGSKRPTTSIDAPSKFANFEPCKLVTPQSSRSNLGYTTSEPGRNQYEALLKHPSPNTVIQLIPVYASDTAQPTTSPASDYKLYLDFFRNWIQYSSDFGSNVKVQIPDSYIKMNSSIGTYGLQHPVNWTTPSHVKFNQDLVANVDPYIDFKGANLAVVVAPPGTEAYVLSQAAIGPLNTQEGRVTNVMTEYAAFATNPQNSP